MSREWMNEKDNTYKLCGKYIDKFLSYNKLIGFPEFRVSVDEREDMITLYYWDTTSMFGIAFKYCYRDGVVSFDTRSNIVPYYIFNKLVEISGIEDWDENPIIYYKSFDEFFEKWTLFSKVLQEK